MTQMFPGEANGSELIIVAGCKTPMSSTSAGMSGLSWSDSCIGTCRTGMAPGPSWKTLRFSLGLSGFTLIPHLPSTSA